MNSPMSKKAIAVILSVAALTTVAPTAWAQLEGIVFSVNTDKKVYATWEPIHAELIETNTGNNQLDIKPHPAGPNGIAVVDLSTGQFVYTAGVNIPNTRILTLPAHAQESIAVVVIPASRLLGGGKKYVIYLNYTVDLKLNSVTTTEYNTVSTVITVK